jgi:hypothetical protein
MGVAWEKWSVIGLWGLRKGDGCTVYAGCTPGHRPPCSPSGSPWRFAGEGWSEPASRRVERTGCRWRRSRWLGRSGIASPASRCRRPCLGSASRGGRYRLFGRRRSSLGLPGRCCRYSGLEMGQQLGLIIGGDGQLYRQTRGCWLLAFGGGWLRIHSRGSLCLGLEPGTGLLLLRVRLGQELLA